MALVVEDGTAKADAESLASVAAFKAHCDARGITYGTDAEIEAQLRKGTDYLGQKYGQRLSGYRVSTTQALDFPRYDMPRRDLGVSNAYYASDAVPAGVVKACIEAAIRAGSDDLSPDLTQAIKREKVGPIETEYQDYTNSRPSYPVIDALMAPFLAGGAGPRMVRA